MNVWENLKPQVSEIIQDLYYLGWDAEQLSDAVNHPDWLKKDATFRSPFADERNFVLLFSVQMTLKQACKIVDGMTTFDINYENILRMHITSLIWAEHEREIKEREAQREFDWNIEGVLGREIA